MGRYPASGPPMASLKPGVSTAGGLMPGSRMELTLCQALEPAVSDPVPMLCPVERSALPAPKERYAPLRLPPQKPPPALKQAALSVPERISGPTSQGRAVSIHTHTPDMRRPRQVETGLSPVRHQPGQDAAAVHRTHRKLALSGDLAPERAAALPPGRREQGMNAPNSNVLAGLKKDPVICSSPADRNAVSIPRTGVKKIEGAAGRAVKTGNRISERVVKSTKRGLPRPLKIKEYDPPEKAAQLAARAPG